LTGTGVEWLRLVNALASVSWRNSVHSPPAKRFLENPKEEKKKGEGKEKEQT